MSVRGQEVKGGDHRRPKIDLEAWQSYRSGPSSFIYCMDMYDSHWVKRFTACDVDGANYKA